MVRRNGIGPMIGRGLGPCGSGYGRRRGRGRGVCAFYNDYLIDAETEKSFLENEKTVLERRLKNIEDRLSNME